MMETSNMAQNVCKSRSCQSNRHPVKIKKKSQHIMKTHVPLLRETRPGIVMKASTSEIWVQRSYSKLSRVSKHFHWSFLLRLVLPPDCRRVEVHSYVTSVLAAALTSRTANEGNFCMAPGAAGQYPQMRHGNRSGLMVKQTL